METTTSSVDADISFNFVRGILIPNMLQFNGNNPGQLLWWITYQFTTLMMFLDFLINVFLGV